MSKNQKLVPYKDSSGKAYPYFYVDTATGVIYFRKTYNGRRIKFSCKTTNITVAIRFANKEFDSKTGKSKKGLARSLIKDELPLWLKVKDAEGLKPDSIKNVRNGIKQIEAFWGDKFPDEITRDNLSEWPAEFAKQYPGQQMENAIKQMRGFCRYLAEKSVNGVPLLPTVPKITDPNRKKIMAARKKKKERIFTSDEFKIIHSTAEEPLEALVVLFMYTMATRIDETLNLCFDDQILLDVEPPVYRWSVGQNKADLWGQHALHPILIGPLTELRKQRTAERTSRLFPQKKDNSKPMREQMIGWKGWRKRAALDWHWTSHTMRHTCLSNLFNDERNPQALICKLYRVSLAVAIETYIKPTKSGIEKMRTAIEVSL